MKFLDEIKNYSAKKALIPLTILMGLVGTYQMNAQTDPKVIDRGAGGIETTCELLYTDFNNDGNIDEVKITKDEKNNQLFVYLKKGDEQGNLTDFPPPISKYFPKPTLKIDWNSKTYIKAIINDFDNNNIQDFKFITRDDKGIKQYNFYGDGKGNFTNNPDEKYWLKPVKNN